MKKLGLGLLGLMVIAGMYYFTTGAGQITAEIKTHISQELNSLGKEGFRVKQREIKEEEEHFILSFDDPEKIAHFLSRQGVQLNVNDAKMLKGLQVGVDVYYLNDAYSVVSFDIYPVTLPTILRESAYNDAEKKSLTQIEEMLKQKAFLVHIAVNKLGTGFKGYMKDIDEVLHGDKDMTLRMHGLKFSGDIKEKKLKSIHQTLQKLTIQIPNNIEMILKNLVSNYEVTGDTPYDYSSDYNIEKAYINAKSKFNVLINDILIHSTSTVKDGLASGTMHIQAKSMHMTAKSKTYIFETFAFETYAKGLDISAFEKLQHIDVNNKQELNILMQQMLSKGVSFEIPNFSVMNIVSEGHKLGGFNITSKVDLDKSFNVIAIEANPLLLLSSIDANLHITLSKELFSLIAQQPQAMMALMLFQPKDINGKKVYKAELKDGKVKVNGIPVN